MNKILERFIRVFISLILVALITISSLQTFYIKSLSKNTKEWNLLSDVTCKSLDIKYPTNVEEGGDIWLESDKSFFRSAYYDYRLDSVAVVALIPKSTPFFYCLLWFEDEKKVWIQPAIPGVIPDTHNRKYFVSVYKCNNPLKDSFPHVVSLTKRPCSNKYNATLKISYVREKKPERKHWCLSPIFGNSKIDITEALALHKTIGIDNATIYVKDDALRKKLDKIDWVKTVKWSLPVPLDEIHYHGQCAAMNDCLYQNMFSAKYMVFTDLDEIFLPRRIEQDDLQSYPKLLWKEIESVQNKFDDKIGTFYMKSALFPTPFHFNGTASLSVVKRFDELQNQRKKFIILPDRVLFVGIHQTFPIGDYLSIYISQNILMLHHYRRCRTPEIGCMGFEIKKNKVVTDEFALMLKSGIQTLQKKYKNLLLL